LDDNVDLSVSIFARQGPRHKLVFGPYTPKNLSTDYLEKLQSKNRSLHFKRITWMLNEWNDLKKWVNREFDFDNQLGRVWLRYSRPSRQVDEDVKPRLVGLLVEAWENHHGGNVRGFWTVKGKIEELLMEHRGNRVRDVEERMSVWRLE
jgi:hypothetical protein